MKTIRQVSCRLSLIGLRMAYSRAVNRYQKLTVLDGDWQRGGWVDDMPVVVGSKDVTGFQMRTWNYDENFKR